VGNGNTPRVVADSDEFTHARRNPAVNYTSAMRLPGHPRRSRRTAAAPTDWHSFGWSGHAVWESWTSGVQVQQSVRTVDGWTPPENVSESSAEGGDPALAADADGNLHMFWTDSREGSFDIHYSRLVPGIADLIMALNPDEWKMALSIRPTLRWDSVAGATSYRIRLYRSTNGMALGARLVDSLVLAATSHDPENPLRQLWQLDEELTTGLNLSSAGYFWLVDAFLGGDALAASEIASFQIPPLGGAWAEVRAGLCEHAPCYYPSGDNLYWNQYDSLIYKWGEAYNIPAALLKALYVGESASAIGPRRIGTQDFSPARAYMYEPYVDWNKYDTGGTPCAGRTYGVFCVPDHPPTESFEGLGPNPYPYDRTVPPGTTISNYAYSSALGGPFSDLGPWGMLRIPGCAPGDPEECPAGNFPAQYRLAASYGLGQIVYNYNWWYLLAESSGTTDGGFRHRNFPPRRCMTAN
jgi:hypothetical protein